MEREPTPEWLDRESALDEVYMACLGWFVHALAGAESMLFRLLVEKCGLKLETGAAVFSGTRMKPAMDSLNRLFESEGMALEKDALSRPFKHLSEISGVRDDILHFGTDEDDGGLFVSNATKKHIPERATRRTVSAEDLFAMVRDLQEIELHFVASMFRTRKPRDKKTIALYTRRLAEPWWYKPHAPVPRQDSGRQKNRARKRPPRPSSG